MTYYTNELYHHGILGQKWGIRRYQNPDGTLTAAGKARYGTREAFEAKQKAKAAWKDYSKSFDNAYNHNHPYSLSKKRRQASEARWEEAGNKAEAYNKAKADYKSKKVPAKERRRLALEEKKTAREVEDRAWAKKHYGVSDKEYDDAMKAIEERRNQDRLNTRNSQRSVAKVMAAGLGAALTVGAVTGLAISKLPGSSASEDVLRKALKTSTTLYGPGTFDFGDIPVGFIIKK